MLVSQHRITLFKRVTAMIPLMGLPISVAAALNTQLLTSELPDVLGSILYFPFFEMAPAGPGRYLINSCMMVTLMGIALTKRVTIRSYFYRACASLRAFDSPMLQHYLIALVILLPVSVLVVNRAMYQTAIWFAGDFVIIGMCFWVVLIVCSRRTSTQDFGFSLEDGGARQTKPIMSVREDRIGFRQRVRDIYEQFEALPNGHESVSIGIVGDYGSGKSSLMFLVAEHVRDQRAAGSLEFPRTKMLYFNVARYASPTTLYVQFFKSVMYLLENDYLLPFRSESSLVSSAVDLLGKDTYRSTLDKLLPLADAESFHEQIGRLLTQTGVRIIVLMDDVDRLLPKDVEAVIRLLLLIGTTKNIFNLVASDIKQLSQYQKLVTGGPKMSSASDLLNKYFDAFYQVPGLRLNQKMGIIETSISSVVSTLAHEGVREKAISQIKKKADLWSVLDHLIISIRSLNQFERILSRNMVRLQLDVFLPDTIVMSALEATAAELWDRIRLGRDELVFGDRLLDQVRMKLALQSRDGLNAEGARAKKVKEQFSDSEAEAIDFLFPHLTALARGGDNIRHELDLLLGWGEREGRAMDPLSFNLFFYLVSPDDIARKAMSREVRDDLLNSASAAEADLGRIVETLRSSLPKETSYRELFIRWLGRQIEGEATLKVAHNLTLALSILAKDFSDDGTSGFWGEKGQGAFLVFNYLRRENADHSIIIHLQELDNSDVFAAMTYYFVVEVPEKMELSISPALRGEMIECFRDRLRRKVQVAAGVFDSNFSDAPNILLWYWRYLDDRAPPSEGERLHDFLIAKLSHRPADFISFLRQFLATKGPNLLNRGQKLDEDSISRLFTVDRFVALCQAFTEEEWGQICVSEFRETLSKWRG